MPKYLFTAKAADGSPKSGEVIASSEQELAAQLRSEGFLVTSMRMVDQETTKKKSISIMDRFSKIPLKEKLFFTRNLAVMISSGLSVGRALNNLSLQTTDKKFQKILQTAYLDVQKGMSVSDALAKHPSAFDDLFVNMVRVGEVGGSLEESLGILTIQIEKENDLRSKVRGAMIYPAVIVFAMTAVGVLMLTYILPQITGVFVDMDVTLPKMTLILISMSDALREHSVIIAILFVFGGFGLKFFLTTKMGKRALSFLVLHLPAIKNIVIKVNSARFARIYSSLLRSGVSVIGALDIVADTLANEYYKEAIHSGRDKIQKGVEMSVVIEEYPKLFPVILAQMVKVGEETGQTEQMLMKIAEFYEAEVSQITKNMSSIIEPVLMIVIGTGVGFFAIAMLQPMYSVLENIQ